MAATGMSRSGVGQVIDRLALIRLIESSQSPDDRRVVLTTLTTAGRNRVIKLEAGFGDYFGTPNPLVDELLDILAPSSRITRQGPGSPLDTIARLSGLGARLSERISSEVGITETRERLAVATLAEHGDTRPGELADVLRLTSGGTTYLVDQLVADGLAERLYGAMPSDRRAVLIRLTPSGLAASERFADVICEHAGEIVEELTSAHAPR
jgi:DNA-binding MarR family transcriptional regulator